MIYFAFMVVLVLATGAAFSYGAKQRATLKALEPSEEDQQIILALKEGTLTDEDLEGIGIDATAFRAEHMPVKTKQQAVADFVSSRGFRFLSSVQKTVEHQQSVSVTSHGQRGGITASVVTGNFQGNISVSMVDGNLEISTGQGRLSLSRGRRAALQAPHPPVPPIPPMPAMLPMRPMAPVLGDSKDAREYSRELRDWEREVKQAQRDHDHALREHQRELRHQQREHDRAVREHDRALRELD